MYRWKRNTTSSSLPLFFLLLVFFFLFSRRKKKNKKCWYWENLLDCCCCYCCSFSLSSFSYVLSLQTQWWEIFLSSFLMYRISASTEKKEKIFFKVIMSVQRRRRISETHVQLDKDRRKCYFSMFFFFPTRYTRVIWRKEKQRILQFIIEETRCYCCCCCFCCYYHHL